MKDRSLEALRLRLSSGFALYKGIVLFSSSQHMTNEKPKKIHMPRNNPKKFCSYAKYAPEREKSLANATEEGPKTRCGSTGSSAGSSNPRSGDRHNKSSQRPSSPASITTHHFEFRCEPRPSAGRSRFAPPAR